LSQFTLTVHSHDMHRNQKKKKSKKSGSGGRRLGTTRTTASSGPSWSTKARSLPPRMNHCQTMCTSNTMVSAAFFYFEKLPRCKCVELLSWCAQDASGDTKCLDPLSVGASRKIWRQLSSWVFGGQTGRGSVACCKLPSCL